MRFALTKQISDAIINAGIKPKTNFILIAVGNKKNIKFIIQGIITIISKSIFKK